jgi:hypothetical protein
VLAVHLVLGSPLASRTIASSGRAPTWRARCRASSWAPSARP